MMTLLSNAMFLAAAVGLVLLLVQVGALFVHSRRRTPVPTKFPRISILKPLCGRDDDLEQHLETYANLDYPDYELLLGLRDVSDTALPAALAARDRHPGRVRVVMQRVNAGLNPKVNQLVTLSRAATGDLLVVSDSNARAPTGFLREIAAIFEDPMVGIVGHPIVGAGEESLGAALDNLYMASIGLGVVAAKRVAGQDLIVGKTMSMRASDLKKLGGFEVAADVLAEDHLFGVWVPERLGLRVEIARTVVESVVHQRGLKGFVDRYARWHTMQRRIVGPVYYAQLLLNPSFLALIAAFLAPTPTSLLLALSFALVRIPIDAITGRLLQRGDFSWTYLAAVPLKDLLIGVAWVRGYFVDTIDWRGTKLRVLQGSRLEVIAPAHPAPLSPVSR